MAASTSSVAGAWFRKIVGRLPAFDPRMAVAGRKLKAAGRHEETAARFREEAAALRTAVAADLLVAS